MLLRQILYEFLSKKCSTEVTKLVKLYYENSVFLLSGDFHWLFCFFASLLLCFKNRPKSRSGELRGRFGGLLACLGRSKGFLRASWIVLETSWKRFGREKWPTWRQLGLKLAPKTEAKSVLSRPGGVWRASWRPHVADVMHFGCI